MGLAGSARSEAVYLWTIEICVQWNLSKYNDMKHIYCHTQRLDGCMTGLRISTATKNEKATATPAPSQPILRFKVSGRIDERRYVEIVVLALFIAILQAQVVRMDGLIEQLVTKEASSLLRQYGPTHHQHAVDSFDSCSVKMCEC